MGMTVMFHNLYLSRDDILSCQLSGSRSKQSNIPEINYTYTLQVKNGIPSVYCYDNQARSQGGFEVVQTNPLVA